MFPQHELEEILNNLEIIAKNNEQQFINSDPMKSKEIDVNLEQIINTEKEKKNKATSI